MKPTVFENDLLRRGIELINLRPYHPQTNDKLERFFRTLEEELPFYGDLDRFIECYNEERLHFSLDIDNYQTPLKTYRDKAPSKKDMINAKWMDVDASE